MSAIALIISFILLVIAVALRAAGASLVRTPRADALHDAADGRRSAERIAELLEDKARLQPAMGMMHSALLVTAAVPAAWAITTEASDWATPLALVGLGIVLVLFGDLLPRSAGRRGPV